MDNEDTYSPEEWNAARTWHAKHRMCMLVVPLWELRLCIDTIPAYASVFHVDPIRLHEVILSLLVMEALDK